MELIVNGFACKIKNQLIEITFSSKVRATSLLYKGKEMIDVKNSPKEGNSFYCDYFDGQLHGVTPTELKVIENNNNWIHIAYIDDKTPVNLEYHLLVKNNDPAIYGYVIASTKDVGHEIGQFRTVYRVNRTLFPIAYNHERQGLQPSSKYLAKHEKLQDETFKLPDSGKYSNSNIYSKYDYSGYFKDNDFWGHYGEKYGFWFIPIDKSGYASGPLRQDLLVHYDGITLNCLSGSHYGVDSFNASPNWQKLYGPWCIYINDGNDKITDVKKRVAQEQAHFPNIWLSSKEKNYPKQVFTLTGNLQLNQEDKIYDWMVVLTNEKGDYYNHNAGHIYYAETKKSNHFTMNHIQPDTYYMYAYIRHTGISEEFYLGSYKINKNLNLDKLIVDYKEKPLIWKIGGYSKTTESFKFGDQLRNHIWKDLTPATLNYRIGSKDDWYYLQSNRGEWMIQFKKPKQTAKNYLLTVCLAGTSYQASSEQAGTDIKYTVKLNDTILNTYTFENDRSAYRSSVTGGRTQKLQMKISAEQLIDNNVIHFQTNGYVAYDMIKLEIEE